MLPKHQESAATSVPPPEAVYKWPLSFMKPERYRKGHVLFRAGDEAEALYYIARGAIRLVESNKLIREDEIVGEMGILSPFKTRTASAVCEEDLEAYVMGKADVIRFFGEDPQLALNLVHVSIRRFIENLKAETAARERMQSELRIASEIQLSMLPRQFPAFPERSDFDIFAIMDSASEVGGDLYDFFMVGNNRLCFLIGDVSGKGVPAALYMAISKYVLKAEALRGSSALAILTQLNNTLAPENRACTFVTLLVMILDTDTGELEIANGGHPSPILCRHDGHATLLELAPGMMVGAIEDVDFSSTKLALAAGDTFFVYTDGVTEARNPQRQLFTEERLLGSVSRAAGQGPAKLIETVRAEVEQFEAGEAQSDDITMLAVTYQGRQTAQSIVH